MLCHVCGDPAIGQCRICHQFHCGRHGRQYCVLCREQEELAAPPAPARSAPATAPAPAPPAPAEGPAAAEEAKETTGPCAFCGQPAGRACPLCGRRFCNEHRGWREVRIGRYNLRRAVCSDCNAPAASGLAAGLFWLLALLALAGGGAAIYWLTTTRW
jgi:hypothetical protein